MDFTGPLQPAGVRALSARKCGMTHATSTVTAAWSILAGLATSLSLATLLSCTTGGTHRAQPSTEELMLRRQVEELRKLVGEADRGSLLDFDQMMVVVDQGLVQRLLASVVPLEGDVGGGFHVRIDAAQASFADGFALLSLAGVVRLGDSHAWAAAVVHGGLDVGPERVPHRRPRVRRGRAAGALRTPGSLVIGGEPQGAGQDVLLPVSSTRSVTKLGRTAIARSFPRPARTRSTSGSRAIAPSSRSLV